MERRRNQKVNKSLQKIKSIFIRPKKLRLPFPTIDIHSHILPGVDDGFQRTDDSVEALRRLSEIGMKEVILTPHMHPGVFNELSEQDIKNAYARFQSRIPKDITIKTSLAAEYMIEAGFEDRAEDPDLLTFKDDRILVEMSYMYKSKNMRSVLFHLAMSGKKPILAHPERYTYMLDYLKDFDAIVDNGCSLQLNMMSLTGLYGPDSMKILKYLLTRGLYKYVGTDLHSLSQLEVLRKAEVEEGLVRKVAALY